MLRRIVLTIVLAAVPLILFLGYYFHSDVRGELIDPFVQSEQVVNATPIPDEVFSDIPVSCILEHGTFEIAQQECDEMLRYQNNPDPNVLPVTCEIPAGTFLVSARECEILKNAKGSSDVTLRIDQ